ncbi:hypothetical protein AAG906_012560 [Vitis piasezkii]
MDGVVQLQRQLLDYTTLLFQEVEGFLNDQFTQLQQLQDETNPDFVVEVVDQQSIDFRKVDSHVHQLKGSSSSIGAQRVQNVCIASATSVMHRILKGLRCLKCLQQVKNEYALVKNKLETLFQLEQILAAGGSIPM